MGEAHVIAILVVITFLACTTVFVGDRFMPVFAIGSIVALLTVFLSPITMFHIAGRLATLAIWLLVFYLELTGWPS